MIEIPPQRLSADILDALIEEYVLREGTDYGRHEIALEDKIAQVRGQIGRGEVLITFDPASENCNLLSREQYRDYLREQQ